MKHLKKFSGIFLAAALFFGLCLPGSVSAEKAPPPITVTVADTGTFSGGEKIYLPLSISNESSQEITITKVTIEKNGSFSEASSQDTEKTLGAKGTDNASDFWNLSTRYTGKGSSAQIRIEVEGYTDYVRNLSVPGATPNQSGGGSGDSDPDLPEDAKPFVYAAKKTTFRAGEAAAFPLTIATTSGYRAENVRITVSGEEEAVKNGFAFNENNGSYVLDYIRDQQEITPTLVVSPSVPDGNYTLRLDFRYEDYLGNSYTASDTVRVTVNGRAYSAIYIKGGAFDRTEIGKENKAILTIELVNPTGNNYNNLTVAMSGQDNKLTLYENFQPVRLYAIDKGETVKASFAVYADAGVTTGNYPITFDVSYEATNGTVYKSQETIYVLVTRTADVDKEQTTSKPRIIIQSYQTSVDVIEAGKSFDLEFTLQNTSADTEVTNVKVVLGSEEASTSNTTGRTSNSVFFPSEGSNSFFIEQIPPKGSISNHITLTTSQDVEPGVYSLTLNIEYDANGSPASPSDEKLAFPVAQQQRLDIQGFSVDPMTPMGGSVPVTFQYINKGKSTIYNFSVDVEGDFALEDTTMSYIGNLTSGYNDTYENYLVPTKEGTCSGAILLKYEDSQGSEKVERQEFTVEVMGMDMPTGGGMMGGMDFDPETGFPLDPETGLPIDPETGEPVKQGGIPLFVWFIIGGVVLAAGAAVTVILILRKKKKAGAAAEDEEEGMDD